MNSPITTVYNLPGVCTLEFNNCGGTGIEEP